ncbi:hypothetical protein DICPUDRAFT_76060 [Dictyostelium purpureum]|uniref:Uncharacterized protein n=1 Tax=Dictyostelium purpureum TaxID=5786 RepID=F0ZCH1_DICPU|nr:uncharacterized protein DICPUDRAFT_76060 [Dictyostelium purpureum]EGC38370.1 hypothetical protein DICPUDRAFT_76060 [Dictyostelium purpureum]|eukprot:XP_003285127.1 hypothetical protein DICPUDRAFT_76060 [Dictyostelium purpureum]
MDLKYFFSGRVNKKILDPNNIFIVEQNKKTTNIDDNEELSNLIKKVKPCNNPNDPVNILFNNILTEKRTQGDDQCSYFSVTESINSLTPTANFYGNLKTLIKAYKENHPKTTNNDTLIKDSINLHMVSSVASMKFGIPFEIGDKKDPNQSDMAIKALISKKRVSFGMELSQRLWCIFGKRAKGERAEDDAEREGGETSRHAMNIVGFNLVEDNFIIKNYWGEKNFIYLPFKVLDLIDLTKPELYFF